jgi:hypothetical protein
MLAVHTKDNQPNRYSRRLNLIRPWQSDALSAAELNHDGSVAVYSARRSLTAFRSN